MNVLSLFERAARAYPGNPALFEGDQLLRDYGGLLEAVRRRATWMRSLLRPSERVVLCMTNCPAYLELLYAALWAGATVVPVNAKLHPQEVDYIIGHCGAKLAIGDRVGELKPDAAVTLVDVETMPGFDAFAESEIHQPEPEDVAWLFYTSGTTGRPKGAMLTHANLLAMTLSYRADVQEVDPQDTYVYAAPISHGAGLYTFAYAAGAARHVVPRSGGFDPVELFGLARSQSRVCMFAAPTMLNRLVDQAVQDGVGGEGFRCIVYGGGPMYVADLERSLDVLGPRLAQIYGQGETPMTITCLKRDEVHRAWQEGNRARTESVGRPHSVVEVRVLDENGRPAAPGESGEVTVRGLTVMRGYWGDAASTAAALRDGWLHTGDVGSFDINGFLTLRDRSKDVIITGGSNVYPREVEEVLLEHPAVTEVSVIGVPDAEWGEKVVAFVVAGGAVADEDLDAMCLQRIARFKRPKEYVRIDELPKNANGKVLKTKLRQLYSASDDANSTERVGL